ncbi:hypothetical protein BRD56_02870 [Thermoplasmatales archaeon SW_10_69_26]|jgi:hypothetical protein|nr:MAG: hypothetical protein BRD56_02870 [Thermoplasmatales archaeon SW_10_69_26]
MARLREIPEGSARQALTNKVLDEEDVREAYEDDPVRVDLDELDLVATDIGVPELLPYEYVYLDVYTDGDRFFIDINETEYRRSSSKTLEKPG